MGLNHVNIRTNDLERMRAFLEDVTGVKAGPRPDFDNTGYWLYDGEKAIFHLMAVESEGEGIAGSIDHVAVDGFVFEPTIKAIEAAGHEHRVSGVPGTGVRQIFVYGPDGIAIELQCAE